MKIIKEYVEIELNQHGKLHSILDNSIEVD